MQRASYLTSLFIVVTGVAPLFWRPICQVYGRRPVFLVSLICSLAGNVGCAVSPSFATMALCRAITAFFICPPASIGSAVVSETFFRTDRARYMGVWTAMVTLGVPMAAFLFGFAVLRVGYRWIYWTLAIVRFCATLMMVFFLFRGANDLIDQWRTIYLIPISRAGESIRTLGRACTVRKQGQL